MRRVWLTIAAVLMLAAIAVPFVRGGGDFGAGFNFGIEFRGGSQFQVSDASSVDPDIATEAVHSVVPDGDRARHHGRRPTACACRPTS